MQTAQEKARNQAQLLISSELTPPYTREVIGEQVDLVLGLKREWRESVDRDALIKELETVFNVWVGEGRTLEDNTDHEEWLLAQRGSIDWKYWSRYRLMLGKSMAPSSLARLHDLTDEILGRLEAPNRPGAWDRRGMVVGHVQSGKTGNYTGLICKAADAGYKVIVVLAGIHSNLRSQTQIRLDEGFLGYDSSPVTSSQPGRKPVGVGLIDQSCRRPNTITTRHESGDFSKAVARQFSIYPGDTPLLFVIKKNASVLKNLLEWVESAALQRDPETNRPIVEGVPLLVIDDEADNASVDTRGQAADENGVFDPDHDPTVINKRIRRLLHCFEKSAYVGYTATPFANIFIHENGATKDEGEDLFPRSFIVNLPAPSNYAGPTKIFGLEAESGEDHGGNRGLPLVRIISDHAASDDLKEKSGWMPPIHNKSHVPYFGGQNEVPPSLRRALLSFLLVCAARRARGQVNAHNTMLIHVSRFTEVQGRICDQVKAETEALTNRLRFGDGSTPIQLKDELRALWQEDFVGTTEAVNAARSNEEVEYSKLTWEQVEAHLAEAASACQVRQINGYAKDVLDYESHKEIGLNVIAVGGDKLARGLTLEGLSVSYFLRASRMYDTLMQMGRWFGYRPGYLDLCRLYMTKDLQDWFKHITEASEELRKEFEHMAITGGTPKDYGLKVQSHPVLMVTSKVKMRNGTPMEVSFAGSIRETIHYHREPEFIKHNFDLASNMITRLGPPEEGKDKPVSRDRPDGKATTWENTYLWHGVSPDEILRFLENYKFHSRGGVTDWKMIGNFIKMQNEVGELTDWTVTVISRNSSHPTTLGGLPVGLIERRPHMEEQADPTFEPVEKSKDPQCYMIRRLLSPRDEAIDLDLGAYSVALKKTQDAFTVDPARSKRTTPPDTASGPMIRNVRPKERGLLLIYPITENAEVTDKMPVIGFGVSFPGSKSGKRVTYIVNNIYAEQEFGGDY